jgi:hypothetical protein
MRKDIKITPQNVRPAILLVSLFFLSSFQSVEQNKKEK